MWVWGAGALLASNAPAQPASAPGAAEIFPNPFFAMDTGTQDANHRTADAQAAMLKELGYAGVGATLGQDIPAWHAALDKHGLKMSTLYVTLAVDNPDGTLAALDKAVKELTGRDTIIWLAATNRKVKPSSTDGDEEGVKLVQRVCDLAARSNLRVALYPHTGFWVEKVSDAVRVAKAAKRANLGVTWNLCHWLRVDGESTMEAVLELAAPYLMVVTINGADRDGKDWKTLIQTLDRGTFDVGKFLKAVTEAGFSGPIGLQGYGIGGSAQDNLTRSIGAWRGIVRKTGAGRIYLMPGKDMTGWKNSAQGWEIVAEVVQDPQDERLLKARAGEGIAVNGKTGKAANICTTEEFGDIEAHVEFMIPKGSNSGVYFMGRYEVQVYDSFGVEKDKYPGIECGGIYPRWVDNHEVEGHTPRVNASRPPGQWQSFHVVFRAPRFDGQGRKTQNARFVRVIHNGAVVHENVEVTGPTRAAMFNDEKPAGPIMLQGDHGPVAYRSVWVRKLDLSAPSRPGG
jgi:sugar phosphate isomerase/epimerase